MSIAKVTVRILFPNSPRSWFQRFDLTDMRHPAVANRDCVGPSWGQRPG
jgi:hypothetical protein